MKITKTIQIFKMGDISQEWDIIVDADRKGLNEVLDIVAINLKKGGTISELSIKEGLESMGAMDIIVDQYDWSLEYAEHVAGEKEYNEINRD